MNTSDAYATATGRKIPESRDEDEASGHGIEGTRMVVEGMAPGRAMDRALFGIRCASVCYVPYGDLANHTLLSHRRHPALFARFDEANSRFAFAFAFRTGCAHDSDLLSPAVAPAFIRSLCVRIRIPRARCTPCNRCTRGADATMGSAVRVEPRPKRFCTIVSEIWNTRTRLESPRHIV